MRLIIAVTLALAAPSLQAATAASDIPLRDYVHTVWTQHDGAPLGEIIEIMQTADGYLWITTRTEGLLRFDGMRFVRASTPCTERPRLLARAADGGFWTICGNRLIRRTAQGQFVEVPQTFVTPPFLPTLWILVDPVGRPWFLEKSIRYLEADGTGGREVPLPTASVIAAATHDSEGTLWVSDAQHVVHIDGDHHHDIPVRNVQCLTPGRDGGVFAASSDRIWRLRPGSAPSAIRAPPGIVFSNVEGCLAEDADGALWTGTRQHGVARLHHGRVETLPDSDVRDRFVTEVFVDREGTIWAGATSGLHRFRKPMVQTMPSIFRHLTGLPDFVFVDSRDSVWIAPGDKGGTSRMSRIDGAWQSVERHGAEGYTAIGEDGTGRVWLSNSRNIGYVANGRFVPVYDESHASISNVKSFKRDGRGQLWALAEGVGVYQLTPGLPRLVVASPRAYADFLVSERFGVWVAVRYGNGVEQYVDGRTQVFGGDGSTGADGDLAHTIVEDGDSIWMGTDRSLKRWRHGTWTIWTREHGLPGDGVVQEIATDRWGHLWIMTGGGLLMVPRAQLDNTPDGVPRPLTFARIGILDGVVAHPSPKWPSPRVSRDRDGRLYFTTTDAVVMVDPSALTETSLMPPIVLESVTIDNRPIDPATTQRFVEPSSLQFDYTSLSLRSPENARFRYRLENYDPDWIEAGSQRRVTYGTLPPGAYRFRVIGAGSEGVWNEAGASFAFQIAPVFWRTWWFFLTLMALAAAMVSGLYRLRVHQLTRQFNLGLEARVSERTRIAGELHDGIMQQISALSLMLGTARRKIQSDVEAKAEIRDVQKKLIQVGTELRQLSHELHPASLQDGDLPDALRAYCGEFGRSRGISVSCDADDAVRDLSRDAALALYRIAQEAMGNAVKHGAAKHVDLRLTRSNGRVTLSVTDDGKGFDPKRIGGSGGIGLINMRERGRQLNGTFELGSEPGRGTTVRVTIPFRQAV